LRPRWESAPNGNHGTGSDYAPLKYMATFTNATGLCLATLTTIGRWGRVARDIVGINANFRFQAFFVGKS
jgi:hypothetical protein